MGGFRANTQSMSPTKVQSPLERSLRAVAIGLAPARVLNALRSLEARLRVERYPVLYNVNGARERSSCGRALLVYHTQPFLTDPESPWFLVHQNRRRCIQIATLLGELGYIVDVADLQDKRFTPIRKYAVILSARVDPKYLDAPALRDATKLFLATTIDHIAHNRNVLRRHERLLERRGRAVRPDRIYKENLPLAAKADAIIGVGNESRLETWHQTSGARTFPFSNYGSPDTRFIFESKDFAAARKNFLFFASRTQVQKGLDLLLKIFPRHPDLQLYVCSSYEREQEFCECYHKELFQTPNIHPEGWVQLYGPRFYELIRACAYVIHPTCSEGQAGSVVQCMYAGLIPVVTREAGIDTEEFGVTFADDSIDEIEKVILHLAGLPEAWHREHSLRTRAAAEGKFSETAFLRRWREILREVLPDRGSPGA